MKNYLAILLTATTLLASCSTDDEKAIQIGERKECHIDGYRQRNFRHMGASNPTNCKCFGKRNQRERKLASLRATYYSK